MKPHHAICCAMAFWLSMSPGVLPAAETDEKDLGVGKRVPTTTTWIVSSQPLKKHEGKNTCLAGIHGKERAISIYTWGDDPNVWKLLKSVDDSLASQPNLKAYVVIYKPMSDEQGYNISQKTFAETQKLAKAQDLKRLDVSLARSLRTELLGQENELRIVYSNKREIELCESFPSTEIQPEQLKDILSRIAKLAAKE
jgi:hypothetical protein